MIAVYGYQDDDPTERVVDAAAALGVEVLMIEQRDLDAVDLRLGDGSLVVGDRSVPLDAITGVYVRPLALPTGSSQRAHAVHHDVLVWLEATEVTVANRSSAMESNDAKPFQAQLIARAGFAVPETLITSSPEEVLAFRERHDQVVFKSISGVRSIVRTLDGPGIDQLHRLRDLPVQFQELVPGTDVRVHVVGDAVFATEIRSEAVDYRYAHRDGIDVGLSPISLPDGVRARCRRLAAALDLPFAGIDLRRRPDGTLVCFEVNPMPGFGYYEEHTGAPIADAVVRLLAEGAHF
jgi:glutathione synthase/RimK-type ligase-like ATP-grasp enzyme